MSGRNGSAGALASPEQARLFFEQDMSEPESHALAEGLALVYSARGPHKQSPNEDAAALIPFDPESCVLIVADGVGGVRGGEQASRVAVEAVWTCLDSAARQGGALRTAILDGIESANRAVTSLGVGAATTLAAVEVHGESVRPYHVGDSMILMVGQRGRTKLRTVAHSPVGFAVEAGMLDAAEAMHHEDRHIVSNVLGTPDMRIEVGSTIRMAPRDTLLLASDGLADNLHVAEIVASVRAGGMGAAARRLASLARRRMQEPSEGEPSKPDDLTFLGFRRLP